MPLTKQATRCSGEKLNIHLTGSVFGFESVREVVVDPSEFEAVHVRVMTVFHSLQTGLVALLYWEGKDDQHRFIMPIEGRGTMAFDRFDGISNPKTDEMTGKLLVRIYDTNASMEHDGPQKHFALSFELYKQRS